MKTLALFATFLLTLLATPARATQINGQLVQAGLERLSADPAGTFEGRIYENTTAHSCVYYNGSAWKTLTVSGAIVDADINASAAIADTKLATISTTGKVSNSATTAASANTASAIVARDGSGNFTAGTITAALTGNASTATALAANPTDCASDTYATTIAASGNLTCATVTNAGLAGSIAASKLVGSDIATLGTVTAGVWNGTKVAEAYGGTNQSTYTTGDTLYSSASNTLSKLAGNTSATMAVLTQTGNGSVSAAPVWTSTSGTGNVCRVTSPSISGATLTGTTTAGTVDTGAASAMVFKVNGTEYMELGSTGKFIVGGASGGTAQSGRHEIYNSSSSDEVLYVRNMRTNSDSDGRAGINIVKGSTTNTTSQLFVSFNINAEGTGSGKITANGASTAAFGTSSDRRLKEKIEDLPPQLSNILALHPVSFEYRNKLRDGTGRQTGFIAQELRKIYPDVVSKDTDGPHQGYLSIAGWDKTDARIVKAFQELAVKNDALEERVTRDEHLIDALTHRLEKLEKRRHK